jgi:endonuclease-3
MDWRRYLGDNGNPRRIRALNRRLDRAYGPFKPFAIVDGVTELIVTVLSQNTNDTNRDRAFRSLMKRFPTLDDVLRAPARKIEEAIRVGGLARNKSLAIKKVLGEIKSRYGSFTLDPIAELPIDDAIEALTKLPSVGVKTAACVLVFSYGKPVIPVDTHVHRLSRRLGLVAATATAEQAFAVLMEITPDELKYPFHVFLIRHGRLVCKSQKPNCPDCVLADLCPSAFTLELR